jgi:hypothetical protein
MFSRRGTRVAEVHAMTLTQLSSIALISGLFVCAQTIGCTQATDDDLATEEAALKDPATGEPTCGGKKVLVCHIPPGNPANAHEICIGAPAVPHHVSNHGDPIGKCPATAPPPATDSGTPPPPPPADGGDTPDPVIIR